MAERYGSVSGNPDETGYGQPPQAARFVKGVSGNPKGRPIGRHKEAPYEAVLGQKVTIRDNGVAQTLTAAEAFLLKLSNEGLKGDTQAARLSLEALDLAGQFREANGAESITRIVRVVVAPGSVATAVQPLRMAKKMDKYRDTARILLEPWIVEKALARLGARRLNVQDQQTILAVTRTPKKVKWPAWWTALP
jgi:hypothetical protein